MTGPQNLRIWLKFDANYTALDSAMAYDFEGTSVRWETNLDTQMTTWMDYENREQGFLTCYAKQMEKQTKISVD
jgi:hypothetical protein